MTPIQEMEKRLREGQAAFDLLSGSAYAQQLTVETAKINEQKSKLEELLKLRDRLEVNKGFAIPKTLEGLNAEIEAIRDNEKGLETAKDMLKQFQDELAGIGDQKTALEKIDALLADPKRNALITEETAAQARLTAARVDAERAAKAYTAVLQEINDMAYSEQSGLGVNIEALQKEISLGRDLTETERRRIEMKQELIDLEIKGQKAGLTAAAIDDAKKELAFHQAITLEMYKQLEALQKKREVQAAAQAMQESLEDEIMMLSRGGRELTRYERLLQAIARGTTTWEEATQKNLVVLAQQADALEELNRKHAELKAFFADNLRYVFEGDFEGLFENLRRNVIDRFTDKLSDWFATSILGFDPDSNAPIVGPVVDKLGDTNKILERIAAAVGVKPGMSLPGIPNVFGGGFGGGMSGGGNTPPFNPGYFGGGGSGGWRSIFGDRTGSITQLPNGEDAITTDGRSMWEKLTGKGGPLSVFGPRENVLTGQTSKLGGILGGAGDIASMIGGMIGGRVGGIISAIGAGASMGAMFGPWGAAIGAGIGAIFGFLQGDPKRKEDKNVNIPNLNKGFTEAFKRLNDVLTGVRQMTIDPDEAISRANEIRGEIAGGFGIEFKSKKYRKEAQKMIQAKLGQADSIIDQIKAAAEISRGAADRSKRILPEFAGGSYFADYFRPNGLLPGSFDGADNILAMISRGEMVINPMQQNRVRALAGFDVFAGAGIPNYPRASSTAKLAAGGIAGAGLSPASAPVVNVQPVIHLEGVTFNEGAKAWIEGDNGKRTLVSVIADLRQKRKI
ncbi:MAG: hypothetical protein IT173_13230 [Acidobacteria bacterium]|nr:hypothetical protein [Acidobacteriota bacterium]